MVFTIKCDHLFEPSGAPRIPFQRSHAAVMVKYRIAVVREYDPERLAKFNPILELKGV